MEERLLATFVAVADAGTVSEAAHRLALAQSAVSRQLQRLQRDVGLPLFTRSGVRLVLSAAGQAFLPVARRVLAEHRAAEQAARTIAAGRLVDVRIAAPGTTLIDVVIPFVATLGADQPRPRVAETQLDDSLEEAVLAHDLVVMPSAPPPAVASLALADLPLWAYVTAAHPWAGRDGVELSDLAAQPLVVPARSFKARRVLDGALDVAGLTAPDVTEANSGRVAQALVATGTGVAVVTEDPSFGLLPLRVRSGGRDLRVRLHAAWRPDHHAADALEALAGRLRDFTRERYWAGGPETGGGWGVSRDTVR